MQSALAGPFERLSGFAGRARRAFHGGNSGGCLGASCGLDQLRGTRFDFFSHLAHGDDGWHGGHGDFFQRLVWLGNDASTPERLAARLNEATARAGDIVPRSGSAQGSNEIGKASAAAA